ncbi:hypothetical protein [Candidatus Methylomicrobium oryzae]|jgi:hypothetical protein|uniref:hypothetical protein n=1 Tax=Candidatus Methylomicrobium oryzae TaxID=2802053 RepID=UPI00192046A5|nr:hypothetical protein [Methylomicrobium sp. RS1]MBL1263579.1 hypothetical protein [Methylomicrobium sp. RS1]
MTDQNNNHRKEDNGTLTAKIEETERRLWNRQLSTHIHTDALIKDLRRELASPTTLLLASELGFIVGELTKRPSKPEHAAADREVDGVSLSRAEATPLKEALDFGSLLITLFHALPPTWILETFHPAEEETKPKTEPAAAGKPKAGVELSKSGKSAFASR